MKKELPKIEIYSGQEVPAFGFELMKSVLLPELLGDDAGAILYWSGRKLARLYPFDTIEDVVLFFEKAAWGTLILVDESRGKLKFELSSDLITARLHDDPDAVFTLEAGFLAEQIQRIKGYSAEAYTEVKHGRQKKIEFIVKWDVREPIETVAY
jgi:predicted hydrocarbon binding protein